MNSDIVNPSSSQQNIAKTQEHAQKNKVLRVLEGTIYNAWPGVKWLFPN